jgi:hypothetical protein
MRGLFAGPLARQVADRSVGKLAGFLAAPHQAFTRTSSAAHCTVQPVASQAERASRTPTADPAGPEGPSGPGGPGGPCIPVGPGSPLGPCGAFPHAFKARATTQIDVRSRNLIWLYPDSDRPAQLRSSLRNEEIGLVESSGPAGAQPAGVGEDPLAAA